MPLQTTMHVLYVIAFALLQEQLHVDLIRFSPAVVIHEVRIVPQEKMVHNELEIIGYAGYMYN